ncbi:MAG TPA: BamA/TamA family outer membrane protein, partial [Oscillatoriaceae cyanobacterium]
TYQFGDNYKFAYSISPEGGNLVTLGYEQAVPLLGSQTEFGRTWADWRHYFALPWRHQVLAVRAQGGATVGSHGGKFYLGGFQSATYLPNVDLRTASTVGTDLIDLRGYNLGAQTGDKAFALSTEYRFPLATLDRGYSVYPVFVTTLSGALFAETGQAWDGVFDPRKSLASVGAELVIAGDVAQAPGQVRLGIGQGLVNAGWPALYMDLGSYF